MVVVYWECLMSCLWWPERQACVYKQIDKRPLCSHIATCSCEFRALVSYSQLGWADFGREGIVPTHHKLFLPGLLLSCSGRACGNSINLFTLLFFCFCEFLLRRPFQQHRLWRLSFIICLSFTCLLFWFSHTCRRDARAVSGGGTFTSSIWRQFKRGLKLLN